MALKDWMEAIMFLWRLRGRTMHRDTAMSSTMRNAPDTCTTELHQHLSREDTQHTHVSSKPFHWPSFQ